MDIALIGHDSEWDRRVPLTPAGVGQLVDARHRVFVQSGIGMECGFSDDEFAHYGATLCHTKGEALRRGQLLLAVHAPSVRSLEEMRKGSILMAFLHLVVASREYLRVVKERGLTTIGMELVSTAEEDAPIYAASSEIAGNIGVHIAAEALMSHRGGRGLILGGATGVGAAKVLVLGAGTVGTSAAGAAMRAGAKVVLMDRNVAKLRTARERLGLSVETAVSNRHYISRFVPEMDVVIGCARLTRGRMAPVVVTEEMVASMAPSSVIIDLAMDQGGCVETSRPTTPEAPTFEQHGVIHVCLRNITALAGRTSSYAISHVLTHYVESLAHHGDQYQEKVPDLWRGTYTFEGRVVNRAIEHRFKVI